MKRIKITIGERQFKKKKVRRAPWRRKREDEINVYTKVDAPRYNFMKYWKIVKEFILEKYGITLAELETILFLYDEPIFTYAQFLEFGQLHKWDWKRFAAFNKQGRVIEWTHEEVPRQKKLYTLSKGTKAMCREFYAKLTQEEKMPVKNPLSKGSGKMAKRYSKAISSMNEARDKGLEIYDEEQKKGAMPLL